MPSIRDDCRPTRNAVNARTVACVAVTHQPLPRRENTRPLCGRSRDSRPFGRLRQRRRGLRRLRARASHPRQGPHPQRERSRRLRRNRHGHRRRWVIERRRALHRDRHREEPGVLEPRWRRTGVTPRRPGLLGRLHKRAWGTDARVGAEGRQLEGRRHEHRRVARSRLQAKHRSRTSEPNSTPLSGPASWSSSPAPCSLPWRHSPSPPAHADAQPPPSADPGSAARRQARPARSELLPLTLSSLARTRAHARRRVPTPSARRSPWALVAGRQRMPRATSMLVTSLREFIACPGGREPLAAATRSYARAFGPRLRCDEGLVGVDVYWLFIAPSFRGRP